MGSPRSRDDEWYQSAGMGRRQDRREQRVWRPLSPALSRLAKLRFVARSDASLEGEREHSGRCAWLDASQTKMPGARPGIVKVRWIAGSSSEARFALPGNDD
ncbi:hypothetical protein A4A58_07550 [Tardiphaga robiniae]|uniref:Uncharacterized protein n=1 Tax=Tardiphaga robiniae TaxID=943830 RepID=A0A163ZAS3_9BRAD|nr:hypothetical protein A4A58_07550 [Tardiphaga robiniae]